MLESPPPISIAAKEVQIEGMPALQVASLRYFESSGGFAALVSEITGLAMPAPLMVVLAAAERPGAAIPAYPAPAVRTMLAWRGPTETLLLSADAVQFAALSERAAGAADGCMVDQTGGLCVLRARGANAGDLLLRLGSCESLPAIGEARSGRWAELTVLVACVDSGHYMLVVERVYMEHLLGWIRATAADL
jgi:sarcosine oxidase gamma subunit